LTGSVVNLQDVGHVYGSREVLRRVSLSVGAGEFFGLVGPNGAGKTTALRIMQGLVKPSSGLSSTFGATSWPPDRRRNLRIGVQPQQVALFEQLTVREQVTLFADMRGMSRIHAVDTATRLGLEDSLTIRQEKLSGGQRQRLSVACAIIGKPDLLFLDEPTANVDPVARREMRSLFLELAAAGMSIVYTSHDLNEIAGLCDRVTVLVQGQVLLTDSPDEISRVSGLTTMEVTSAASLTILKAAIAGVIGASLTDVGVTLVATDEALATQRILAIDPKARILNRSEPFEETYIRLIAAAGDVR